MDNPEAPPAVIRKIQGEDLKRQVIASTPRTQTVIVELALPQMKLERSLPYTRTEWGRPNLRFKASEVSQVDIETDIAKAKMEIEHIIGRPAEAVLPSSGTVVVVADGTQIRSIAGLPSVAAIWPNMQRGGSGAP